MKLIKLCVLSLFAASYWGAGEANAEHYIVHDFERGEITIYLDDIFVDSFNETPISKASCSCSCDAGNGCQNVPVTPKNNQSCASLSGQSCFCPDRDHGVVGGGMLAACKDVSIQPL